ncbi:Cactin [Halotydeus destructor]|nr:Cactin [Halotydeus destructor]
MDVKDSHRDREAHRDSGRSSRDYSKSRRRSRSRERSSRRERDEHHRTSRRSKSRSRSKSETRGRKHHKKEKKRRHRSSSSDSSDNSSPDVEGRQKIKSATTKLQQEFLGRAENYEKAKAERKKLKEAMKAVETPEQKRMRRLAKKEAKDKKRKAESWGDDYSSYTNADNPFGDSDLQNTFVWSKKYEKLGIREISTDEIERENRKKWGENKLELEKVKQRRLEREKEREERQEEVDQSQREKELAHFKEWEKQEDGFHLRQAKLRSRLRIKDGRAKPIDKLARYFDVHAVKQEHEKEEEEKNRDQEEDEYYSGIEMREPYIILNGLRRSDLEDLLEDVKVYMKLDRHDNSHCWRDIQIIVEDELGKLRNYGASVDRREGINAAVSADVSLIFDGKTPDQLAALQKQIETKIRSGDEGVDISYWETLLSKLKAHIARARLRQQHQANVTRKLEELKAQEEGEKGEAETEPQIKSEKTEQTLISSLDTIVDEEVQPGPSTSGLDGEEDDYIDPIVACQDEYTAGGYSPIYTPESQLDVSITAIDPEEEFEILSSKRRRVLGEEDSSSSSKLPVQNTAETAFDKEARKGMGKDEATFSVEEVIKQDKSVLSWAEKYRPRKPRYFNRVHTGFEWNKYNQTHYDVDNPPPKIVQGYKFNIFYPDLIDKSKTPQYTITPCRDDPEFSIIRFKAGPPYEDIAFKIVNREWNFSYKSGYRSQFQNNILQLWFHFKRYRYRR